MNAVESTIKPQVDDMNVKRTSLLVGPSGQLVDVMYDKLVDHIKELPEATIAKISSSRKLARLTIGQLVELMTDVCDEMGRRSCRAEQEPHLDIKLEYSPKRNQARQKLADLTSHRFSQLIVCTVAELERRFPSLKQLRMESQASGLAGSRKGSRLDEQFEQLERSLASMPELSNESYKLTNAVSVMQLSQVIEASTTPSTMDALSVTTLNTPKTLVEPITLAVDCVKEEPHVSCHLRNSHVQQPCSIDERQLKGQTFNFDCLDSLIKDLNAMIGHEQSSEIEQLKQRHALELASLKEYTKSLEEQILPAKNQEIARVTARVEELEGRLAMARREHASCTAKLSAKDALIEEQAALIKTLQSSYMDLQNKLSCSALVRGEAFQSAQKTSGIASSVGVFAATWSAFSKIHEGTVRLFETPSASFTERLTALKDACNLTQKLSHDVDQLISRLDTERMPWITTDIEVVFGAKTQCLQTLSYCLVCCKDMGSGTVHNVSPQMLTAIVDLARCFRALVDAAELVASRAQIPSSPVSNQSIGDCSGPVNIGEPVANFIELVKSRFTRSSVAFASLRVFLEEKVKSGNGPFDPSEVNGKLRQSVADALAAAFEVVKVGCKAIDSLGPDKAATSKVENFLTTLAEGTRTLHILTLDYSRISTDEIPRMEAIFACQLLCSAFYDLNQVCIALESSDL